MGFLGFHITYMVLKICPQFNSRGMLLLLMHYISLVKFSVPLWIKPVKDYLKDELQPALLVAA